MEKTKNLMEGLLEEMNRVRELISDYEELPNGAGMFGATIMKTNIKRAEKSISDNDVVAMLRMYEELKGHQ